MKSYLKLLNFELNRFSKFYYALFAIIGIGQIAIVIIATLRQLKEIQLFMTQNAKTISNVFNEGFDKISLPGIVEGNGLGYMNFYDWTIFLGMIVISLYTFFIWYRDWAGKGAFIYRLLMLPVSRVNIILSKITAILLLTLGLAVFQYILVHIEFSIIKVLVPFEFRSSMNITQILETATFQAFLPFNFVGFLWLYGLGIMTTLAIFTGILLERSFGLRGVFAGIGYVVLAFIVFLLPLIILESLANSFYYYNHYLNTYLMITGIIVTVGSFIFSNYLLKNKVNA